MITRMRLRSRLGRLDAAAATLMHRYGHAAHRLSFGIVFIWFGLLKVFGFKSATSIIAQTIYLGSPAITTPILGAWEALIGVCLFVRPLIRVGLLLLAIRLPGTLLALAAHPLVCFDGSPLVPTIVGQYLIKDAMLFAAALVIGGTVRAERRPGVHH